MIPPPSGPTVYAAAVLRVTPDVLPELRRAVDTTLDELTPHLKLMQHGAYLPEPWLGDPVSLKSYQIYNDHVMGARDGPWTDVAIIMNYQLVVGASKSS